MAKKYQLLKEKTAAQQPLKLEDYPVEVLEAVLAILQAQQAKD